MFKNILNWFKKSKTELRDPNIQPDEPWPHWPPKFISWENREWLCPGCSKIISIDPSEISKIKTGFKYKGDIIILNCPSCKSEVYKEVYKEVMGEQGQDTETGDGCYTWEDYEKE